METIRVKTHEELEQCFAVRREVFVLEQGVPEDLELDQFDHSPAAASHLLIRQNGRPAAAARWRLYGDRAAKLQRIAVRKPLRGSGLGLLLLQELEAWAKDANCTEAVLDAQTYAAGFYEKAGYRAVSDEIFLDAGIEHIRMIKKLQGADA